PFGNTAPYLQYAGARIRSIGRKAEAEGGSAAELATATISLDQPAERELALSILGIADVLAEVAAGSQPHRLCTYLFDLAQALTSFDEQCPVLSADTQLRSSRLRLSAIVLEVLGTRRGVLGIRVPGRMCASPPTPGGCCPGSFWASSSSHSICAPRSSLRPRSCRGSRREPASAPPDSACSPDCRCSCSRSPPPWPVASSPASAPRPPCWPACRGCWPEPCCDRSARPGWCSRARASSVWRSRWATSSCP